jgi:DNA-binding transcriptional LysR family regulator
MARMTDLELLVRTAELGSLTAAAKALDWSPAAASAAVKRMEAEWGAPVFVRSTRSLRLSTEGERMLPHIRRALQSLRDAQDAASTRRQSLDGVLQVAMPSDLGRSVLLPWLEQFQEKHPQLALRLHLSDRNTDLMRAPLDVALRYGQPPDSTQVALPLAPENRRVLVAAPGYVARHGSPSTPEELVKHESLRFMLRDEVPRHWRVQVGGQWVEAPVQGRRSSNDGEVVKRWVLAGLGLAYKSWLDVAAEVGEGRLQRLNPQWVGEPSPLYLVVPGRAQMTPAARALRDWLKPRLAEVVGRLGS